MGAALSVVRSPPPDPPPASFNLAAYVLAPAEISASKTALVIASPAGASRWRYGTLAQAVSGIAAGLLAQGLTPGDRVLMRLGNEVEFPLCFLAAIWAGLIPVPASAALTQREVTALAGELAPRLIVAAPGVNLPDAPACPVLPALALREMETEAPAPPEMGDPDRPAYIVYTSGTSGRPRGVVHAHRAIWARRMMWQGWYGLTPEDRVLHAGAFNWSYTLGTGLLDPWTRGATALIPASGVTPDQLPLLLKRHDATVFAAAPELYRQMLKHHTRIDAPRLRHGLSAGEHLSPRLADAWQRATGTRVHQALGLSECSTFVSGSPGRPAPEGATGFPQSGRTLAVLGPDGAPVPRGTPGVLAVHRSDPGLMRGYLNADDETAARMAGDWFVTGDSVTLGPDGAITYLGRDDDMMNAGGVRVSPLEVEAALQEHPGISEVACAEKTVKADTTIIAAYYVAPAPIPEAELRAFAADRLARYKQPRLFAHREALPRSANGKLNRKALRA